MRCRHLNRQATLRIINAGWIIKNCSNNDRNKYCMTGKKKSTIEVNESKKLKYFTILSNKMDPLDQTARTCTLGEWKFLLKKLDHNFEFESIFKNDVCYWKEIGGNNENMPMRPIHIQVDWPPYSCMSQGILYHKD